MIMVKASDASITIRIPKTLKAQLDKIKEIEQRSFNNLVVVALSDYVLRYNEEKKDTPSK
uniref:Uncharacterized protein n=1 Tax=Siphoviridae sp. ctTwu10 TaxID=2825525 RepID=A0A8S5P8W5_9CAUD|nr:MAG TPA: hypothetical protein [Siphoviridae sp. ctTwu10]